MPKLRTIFQELGDTKVSLRDMIGSTMSLGALLVFSAVYTSCSVRTTLERFREEGKKDPEKNDTGKLLDEVNRLRVIVDERLPKQPPAAMD
jgi:hypothetical protein